jgi:hypothetical protein
LSSRLRGRFNLPALAGALEWESLALLRSVSILRIGYLGVVVVPTLAYAIVEWNKLLPNHQIELPLALFLTFLGSTFLATGHLLNETLCPKLIKLHGTHHRYRMFLSEFISCEDTIFRAAETSEKLLVMEQLLAKLRDLGASPDQIGLVAEATAAKILELLQVPQPDEPTITDHAEIWGTANNSRPVVRWIIAIFYGAAALIAGWLALRQLGRVLCAAFPSQLTGDRTISCLFDFLC